MTLPGEAQRYFREVVLTYEGDECLIWPYVRGTNGYAHLYLGKTMKTVSRVLCEEANGPSPSPGHQAAHSCGKGQEGCVTKRHLRWATRAENQADRLLHGTERRGERHGNAKLTDHQVRAIRQMAATTGSRQIAREFGVHMETIRVIKNGKRWAHLLQETNDGQ